ncbi:PREDICTED: mucin-13, partial [Chlamydotis macqueenii]
KATETAPATSSMTTTTKTTGNATETTPASPSTISEPTATGGPGCVVLPGQAKGAFQQGVTHVHVAELAVARNATETTPATPSTTAVQTTTGDLCNPDPCGTRLAKCVALHSISTCLCQYGFFYRDKDCHSGQVFPGVITLKEIYSDSVQNVNSMQYEEVFQNVTEFFKNAFTNLTGFGQTVIVEIQPLKEDRASFPMRVTVTNLFEENSNVTNDTVISAIDSALAKSSYVSQYHVTTYCAAFACDAQTTVCEDSMFPSCICKTGFSKTEWDDRSCSDCSKDCSAEENKYCVKDKGIPTCKCMPNFENKNGRCVSCPVGYSGENCKNDRELILIIVGTVFGAIILCLVIAVSVVSVRATHKKDPERKSLIKSKYSDSNTSDDRQTMMFPRVQTTSGHANPGYQPNNPYEVHSANRSRFPERDYDDLVSVSHRPMGIAFLNCSIVEYRHYWDLNSTLPILPWSRRPKWYKGNQTAVAAAEKFPLMQR